jgi:phosphoribosylformylglycinamidine synthase
VSEAARNIVCSGGEPVAITNCLNFGNPYDKGVYYQFVNALKGMGDACLKFETPVTGGNVSFYNQSVMDGEIVPVYPTPTIGMLGILDDANKYMTLDFKNEGDAIYMLGDCREGLGSSEYLQSVHKVKFSPVPHFDLEEEFALQTAVKGLIKNSLIQSAHDISEGGLFISLLESAMAGGLGFDVYTEHTIRKDAYLFGESQSRVIVSVSPANIDAFETVMVDNGFKTTKLGKVTATNLAIDGENFGQTTDWKLAYDNAIGDELDK